VLESHYCDPDLSLATLAKELAMGEDLVSREIRRTFQDTFKGVLNRMRLQEARRLLAESDLGIAEIAYKVGYGNVSHFNRLAREAWGRTPTEERTASRRDGDGGGNPTRPTT
jgi:AraC-like DNA-binding protein